MSPTVQIGKNGVSDGLLDHIKDMGRSHDTIKLVFLQGFRASHSVDDAVETITAYLDPLYETETSRRGHTVTLAVHDA